MKKFNFLVFLVICMSIFATKFVHADEVKVVKYFDSWAGLTLHDRMTGEITDYIILNESIDSFIDYWGDWEHLYIAISKRQLWLETYGKFETESWHESTARIRVLFDEDPITLSGPLTTNGLSLFLNKNRDMFIKGLKRVNSVMVEFTPLMSQNPKVVNFDTAGFSEAYEWLMAQ